MRAISAEEGELVLRGVSLEQIQAFQDYPEMTLISSRKIDFRGSQIVVDSKMSLSEIRGLIQPTNSKHIDFYKGNSKVTSFVGLSGGVGTTSIAIQYAFELSRDSNVHLIDLSNVSPDIALALGLRKIDFHPEKISRNLLVSEGLPISNTASELVFDLGNDLQHTMLKYSDRIFVVTRIGFNTFHHLQKLELNPTAVLFNFAERSKVQQKWRSQILSEFPRIKCLNIPLDARAFELAGERKSALMEVASNSLARKSIATLIQCESM